mmetsp:Transcript_6806/g.12633  ORF Transcript_6806/g.12633 Transcript_6806/m.12633 type:complete len:88 (-) Transcript_6806:665-928(-)
MNDRYCTEKAQHHIKNYTRGPVEAELNDFSFGVNGPACLSKKTIPCARSVASDDVPTLVTTLVVAEAVLSFLSGARKLISAFSFSVC